MTWMLEVTEASSRAGQPCHDQLGHTVGIGRGIHEGCAGLYTLPRPRTLHAYTLHGCPGSGWHHWVHPVGHQIVGRTVLPLLVSGWGRAKRPISLEGPGTVPCQAGPVVPGAVMQLSPTLDAQRGSGHRAGSARQRPLPKAAI